MIIEPGNKTHQRIILDRLATLAEQLERVYRPEAEPMQYDGIVEQMRLTICDWQVAAPVQAAPPTLGVKVSERVKPADRMG